jgi:ribosomal protein L37AE/L43A
MNTTELTVCQKCARAKVKRDGRDVWIPVPKCFNPKPGVTFNVALCPDCTRQN